MDEIKELLKKADLQVKFECKNNYSLKYGYDDFSYCEWTIHISGKDTYKNREIFKKNYFKWNKETKCWWSYLCFGDYPKNLFDYDSMVPKKKLVELENEAIKYYNSKGLTWPYAHPKCIREGCNEQKNISPYNKNCGDYFNLSQTGIQRYFSESVGKQITNKINSYLRIELCYKCSNKDQCIGGLICCGWMSHKCKYNKPTVKGNTLCKGCLDDSIEWAEEGRRLFGPGGWYSNDNS